MCWEYLLLTLGSFEHASSCRQGNVQTRCVIQELSSFYDLPKQPNDYLLVYFHHSSWQFSEENLRKRQLAGVTTQMELCKGVCFITTCTRAFVCYSFPVS